MMEKRFALTTMALLSAVGLSAHGQIFSDDSGVAANWTIAGDSDGGTIEDVRFGFDYGNYDLFNETIYTNVTPAAAGFLTGSIPESPNHGAGAATTGILLSANNSSLVSTSLVTAIFANGVNVGVGTANPDYKLTFDAYHSVSTGLDGAGPPSATNYQFAGINYATAPAAAGDRGPMPLNPVSSLDANNQSGTTGSALYISGEQGAFDDYEVLIGDRVIEQRVEGFNGLAGAHINQAFIDAGFDPVSNDPPTVPSPLNTVTGSAEHFSPIPGSEATFDVADDNTIQRFYRDQFPAQTGAPSFSSPGANINDNDDVLLGGTPYNSWATHEVYFVDGIWTHVINGTPVLQVDPTTAGDGTQVADLAGTFALGFLDGFSSFNSDPEGSNFVIYDNISLDSAASGDAPDILAFLEANNYIPASTGPIEGDYNGDGFVSQGDLDLVLLNWGDTVAPAGFDETAIPGGGPFDSLMSQNELDGVLLNWGDGTPPTLAVPEPTSLALLGLGGLAMLRRRA